MTTTALICAKDEEATIADVVRDTRPHVDEVIVIDGHSQDATRKHAEEAGATVISDNGKGKGDGYKCGLAVATGDIVVFLDLNSEPGDILPNCACGHIAFAAPKTVIENIDNRGFAGLCAASDDVETIGLERKCPAFAIIGVDAD